MRDADQARRELRRGMFYTPPTLLRPETTMDPTTTNATLNDLTAEYLAVAAACREAYAAKTAADAAHEAAHKRWTDAGSVYAEAAFRLTDGPNLERIVITEAGALLCRLYFGPSAQYSVDHAPIAAVVHAAIPLTEYDPVAGSAGSLDRAVALARAVKQARAATDSSPTPPPA